MFLRRSVIDRWIERIGLEQFSFVLFGAKTDPPNDANNPNKGRPDREIGTSIAPSCAKAATNVRFCCGGDGES